MLKAIICFSLAATAWGATIPQKEQDISHYIVGGRDTDISEIPFQVAMYNNNNFMCGGSIISANFIVTAAHCAIGKNASLITFRAGSNSYKSGGVLVKVKALHIHPQYDRSKKINDVAVAELLEPLKFSKVIQPIPLVSLEPLGDELVQVSGWGDLEEWGELASTLQSVVLPVVDRKTCNKYLETYLKITEEMICAGVEGKDSCQGDSGGPLTVNKTLAGVVSFGIGCARKERPGVYTNVAHPDVKVFLNSFIKAN